MLKQDDVDAVMKASAILDFTLWQPRRGFA